MEGVIFLAAGCAAGGAIGWLVATLHVGRRLHGQIGEAKQRAGAAEGRADTLQAELGSKSRELEDLRARLSAEERSRVQAETQRVELQQRLADERRLLDEARSKLTETFNALAGDALHKTSESFLALAEQKFTARETAMKGLVTPLSASLEKLEQHVRGVENARQVAYSGLHEAVKELHRQTGQLAKSLQTPHVVGAWGQVTLRRVVELCGMSEHCDFREEVSITTENGRLRPDLVVHLPGGRQIVVDAKASFEAYQQAVRADSDRLREEALARHASNVRQHVKRLAEKHYWEQFENAPEFCVMFIPAESFFAAAVAADGALLEDAMRFKVVLATPTTLMSLLRVIEYGWRQEKIAAGARTISELGRELYDRMRKLAEHIGLVGSGLARAATAYNQAVGSLECKVLPAARRFKELGAASGSDIELLDPVQVAIRPIASPELSGAEEFEPAEMPLLASP